MMTSPQYPQNTFAKGHGTANDFVLIADPDGQKNLEPEQVLRWCDRRQGIGGDGLIRAVRSSNVPEGQEILAQAPEAEWFMDYRNADGSIAEMCGNGVRVFVHYLRHMGFVDLAPGQSLKIGTRAGVKTVSRVDPEAIPEPEIFSLGHQQTQDLGKNGGEEGGAQEATPGSGLGQKSFYGVDLGPWTLPEYETATESGVDALVAASGLDMQRPGLSVDMGNPHTVVVLAHPSELEGLDLHKAPEVTPLPEQGSNVEFIVAHDDDKFPGFGEISMRVFERGVGETQSCGTGAAAAAAAARFWAGAAAPNQWFVNVPGGRVRIDFRQVEGREHAILAGPAVVIAEGQAVL